MERFLSACANYIYRKHKNDLSELCLVFPNRRSGSFFTSYLRQQVNSPVLSPEITTINEFIIKLSALNIADRLYQVTILYNLYSKISGTSESFDDFYFWGEVLLSDFNDIDKYLIHAEDLYTNLAGLKEIESHFDYLTETQKKTIKEFWNTLGHWEDHSHQKHFVNVWKLLFPLYSAFTEELTQQGMASEGMSYRIAANLNGQDNQLIRKYGKIYFIGLNALNECEKLIISELKSVGKSEFLWDYDISYIDDEVNCAGKFIRENLHLFPPPPDFIFNNQEFQVTKNIEIIAVPSLNGQSQIIPWAIKSFGEDFRLSHDNTSVVLADESLLFSSLGAIPQDITSVNVTMGYPLKSSVLFGFTSLVVALLKNSAISEQGDVSFYFRNVCDLLNHPLVSGIEPEKVNLLLTDIKTKNRFSVRADELGFSPLHRSIFTTPISTNNYPDYFLEIFRQLFRFISSSQAGNKILLELVYGCHCAVEKLREALSMLNQDLSYVVTPKIFFRLLNQYLSNISIPFEGEPLSGLQVMGILETRCLDFENLILLGLNEGQWPKSDAGASYIPYNLRKGFGLPGIDDQEAISAYYFYRLIQRSKNIVIAYNTSKDGAGAGELSRYGEQLKYLSPHKPEIKSFNFKLSGGVKSKILIPGSKEITQKLISEITKDNPFSPSRLNLFLTCKLKFYYRSVLDIPEPEEVVEEIDPRTFGTIFHSAIERLYHPLIGKLVDRNVISKIRNDEVLIAREIYHAINRHFFKGNYKPDEKVELKGKSFLMAENLKIYINRVLEIDEEFAPFTIIHLEKKFTAPLDVHGLPGAVYIGGIIDRIDNQEAKTRIIDYKTGKVDNLNFSNIDDLFDPALIDKNKEILQALTYCWILGKADISKGNIQPGIYSLRNFFSDNFDPAITYQKSEFNFEDLKETFGENLKQLMTEILSPEVLFSQTEDIKRCAYCTYNVICMRY